MICMLYGLAAAGLDYKWLYDETSAPISSNMVLSETFLSMDQIFELLVLFMKFDLENTPLIGPVHRKCRHNG